MWLQKVLGHPLWLQVSPWCLSCLLVGKPFPSKLKEKLLKENSCVSVVILSTPFLDSCLRSFVVAGAWVWCEKSFLSFQAQQPVLHGGLLQWSVCCFGKPCLIHVNTQRERDWLSESEKKRHDC